MKKIDSLMFGKIDLLEEGDQELQTLIDLIHKYPANSFGIINKLFNSKALCLFVNTLKQE